MCGLLVMQMLLIAHYCVSAGADSATGLGIEILITMMWRLPLMVNQVFVI